MTVDINKTFIECLDGEKGSIAEQARFSYSALVKAFEKQSKRIKN